MARSFDQTSGTEWPTFPSSWAMKSLSSLDIEILLAWWPRLRRHCTKRMAKLPQQNSSPRLESSSSAMPSDMSVAFASFQPWAQRDLTQSLRRTNSSNSDLAGLTTEFNLHLRRSSCSFSCSNTSYEKAYRGFGTSGLSYSTILSSLGSLSFISRSSLPNRHVHSITTKYMSRPAEDRRGRITSSSSILATGSRSLFSHTSIIFRGLPPPGGLSTRSQW